MREAKYPAQANVQPATAAETGPSPIARANRNVNTADNTAAIITPVIETCWIGTSSNGMRVGMNGKFWMLAQNGLPYASRGYQAGIVPRADRFSRAKAIRLE